MSEVSDVKNFYDNFSPLIIRAYLIDHGRIRAQRHLVRDSLPHDVNKVLVIGCGAGDLAHYIATRIARRAEVLGVDLGEENIALAKHLFTHPRVTFAASDVVENMPEGPWDAVILPDVYEHIPIPLRQPLHANIARTLAPDGMVVLTIPSPGYQRLLQEQGTGLQIVDEVVTLEDLSQMAQDVDGELTFFSHISVSNTNDYVHAIIERGKARPRAMTAGDRVTLRRQQPVRPLTGRFWQKAQHGWARAWRSLYFARRMGIGRLRQTLAAHKQQHLWHSPTGNSERSEESKSL